MCLLELLLIEESVYVGLLYVGLPLDLFGCLARWLLFVFRFCARALAALVGGLLVLALAGVAVCVGAVRRPRRFGLSGDFFFQGKAGVGGGEEAK